MIHRKKEHLFHFLPLVLVLFFGLFLALKVGYDRQLQMAIILAVAMFYVAWGVLHHLIEHTLVARIVLEYVLVAVLGVTMVLFLIKQV